MDCAGAVCMVCHNNVECMGGPGSKLVVLVGVGSIGQEVAVGSDSGKYLGVWVHHVSDGSSLSGFPWLRRRVRCYLYIITFISSLIGKYWLDTLAEIAPPFLP